MKTILSLLFCGLFTWGVQAQTDAFKKGKHLMSKGDYAGAIEQFNAHLKGQPEDINGYIQRGMAYSLNQQYDQAVADYNVVLEKHPEQTAIYNSRGTAYMKLEQYDKAITDFNAILDRDPKNQEAYNNRGWCKKHKGDHEGACADWKKSKKLGNGEAKIILQNNKC